MENTIIPEIMDQNNIIKTEMISPVSTKDRAHLFMYDKLKELIHQEFSDEEMESYIHKFIDTVLDDDIVEFLLIDTNGFHEDNLAVPKALFCCLVQDVFDRYKPRAASSRKKTTMVSRFRRILDQKPSYR